MAADMSERRYSEGEAAEIFGRAADSDKVGRRQVTSGSGMTLADLQDIGREVGLSADAVADAARSLDRTAEPAGRRFLGMPIGVGRTIELGRRLSEEEWEQLVVDLRETFDARGRVSAEGSFRQWTNGNLQALLEPTAGGQQRLRLRTVKGDSQRLMTVGLAFVGMAAVTAVAALARTGAVDISALGSLGLIGLGTFGMGAMRLPRWVRTRRSQMEGIVARLALRTATPPRELPSDGS